MQDLKFGTMAELLKWLHQERNAKIEFPTLGDVNFHVYMNAVVGGGVKGNLSLGPGYKEADMGFLEKKPGVLTIAVVPDGEHSIDWGHGEQFAPDVPLETLLNVFPNGRNIGQIVETLKTFNG